MSHTDSKSSPPGWLSPTENVSHNTTAVGLPPCYSPFKKHQTAKAHGFPFIKNTEQRTCFLIFASHPLLFYPFGYSPSTKRLSFSFMLNVMRRHRRAAAPHGRWSEDDHLPKNNSVRALCDIMVYFLNWAQQLKERASFLWCPSSSSTQG